jgi:hypothetical protein
MAKLTLAANPTFKAQVAVPIPGDEPAMIELTFRHRTKTALDEFIKSREDKSDTESFMQMVSGWDLADEFNKENVEVLLENRIGAALAAYRAYIDQLISGRTKN